MVAINWNEIIIEITYNFCKITHSEQTLYNRLFTELLDVPENHGCGNWNKLKCDQFEASFWDEGDTAKF